MHDPTPSTTRINPLIVPILRILKAERAALSEYELIRRLEAEDIEVVATRVASADLTLFKKHFLVMNALYRLQEELLAEQCLLRISPLAIDITGMDQTGSVNVPDAAHFKLREYYLDWCNFDQTGEAEVTRLLAGFWLRYAANEKQQDALNVLGLEPAADWSMIREQYRRMAALHHPDKGGDGRRFIEIREAYETLRCCQQRNAVAGG
jgi:hypothetical protein